MRGQAGESDNELRSKQARHRGNHLVCLEEEAEHSGCLQENEAACETTANLPAVELLDPQIKSLDM